MKKYFTGFIIVCFFTLLIVSVTGAAPFDQSVDSDAANVGETPVTQPRVATMVVDEGSIEWQPISENAGMVLSISGPGDFYLRQEARAGNMPVFFAVAADGKSVPDGSYTYELLALPILAPEVQAALIKGRESGDEASVIQLLREEGKLPQEAALQSGYFTVLNSAIVQGAATAEFVEKEVISVETANQTNVQAVGAPTAPTAQVIAQDLIVQGSQCVGIDCVSSESFGFDTLRLKENNLRIKAQDTSNSASFPTTDWQITFNDSSNGGANKFAIDDIDGGRTPFTIEATAPSNSLYVDDAGRVGLGTATPVVELHVVNGDSPTLRLEQDGSSGFGAQTWDVAGNETNFFVRDATNGSKLPFKIFPSADTNSLIVAANNNIGMGVQSPAAALEVQRSDGNAQILVDENNGTAADRTLLALENNGAPQINFTNSDSGVSFVAGLDAGGGFIVNTNSQPIPRFRIDAIGNMLLNGTLTQLGNSSRTAGDRTIVDGNDYLSRLRELEIARGATSESIYHLAPDAAALKSIYGLGDGESISPLDVASISLSSTQALQAQVQQQETVIADQQQQIDDLEARLAEIEALLAKLATSQ